MRHFLLFLSLSILLACQSSPEKEEERAEIAAKNLDPNIQAIVQFMADSVSECSTWLNMESTARSFFKEADTLADFIEEKFSHDEIIAFYDGINATSVIDLGPYLNELNIHSVDSPLPETDCIASMNNIILLDNNKRAILIFTTLKGKTEKSSTMLLARKNGGWCVSEKY